MSEQMQARISAEVASLQGLNIDELRKAWRERYGAPPYLRSADVFRRCLAERIQAMAFGADAEVEAKIAALVRGYERTGRIVKPRPRLRAGTVLVREHAGKTHRVEVTEAGFVWNGQPMRSLSQIAQAITGAKWNGYIFFGLKPVARRARS